MLTPFNLKVEYKKNPLGMDEPRPRFFYQLEGNGKKQISRRITVTDSEGNTVWDSGEIQDSSTIQITYHGKRLKRFSRYHWQVSVKDDMGEVAVSQEEAYFETGFLDTLWTAKWITGNPYRIDCMNPPSKIFRDFEIKKGLRKARLYATALGVYEAYINGKTVGDLCLTPGWTDYYHRVQYQAYDVTDMLNEGTNCLASLLGEGWYCGRISRIWIHEKASYGPFPMLKMELHLEYESGESEIIATDNTFQQDSNKITAIIMSDIYMGETCDASRDLCGWKLPNGKRQASAVTEVDSPVDIVWQSGADIRRIQELSPRSIAQRPNGSWIVDFGQNLTGRERIRLKNTCHGTHITIRHGEMLNPDGSLYIENLRTAAALTQYSCGNHDEEIYEPVFTFFGFRYLEISGWPGDLTPDQITAQVISSDLESTGAFSCSNPLLNQLYSNIVWGQRSNFLDVPTDCPQRDERLGWTGDTQVFANIASYNAYTPAFYSKWLVDLNLCQGQKGAYPNFAPDPYRWGYTGDAGWYNGAAGWGDAGVICPRVMLLKYGDQRISEKYFDNMIRWINFPIKYANENMIVKCARYGDWLNIDAPTPDELLSTAYLAGSVALLANSATLLGKDDEAAELKDLRNDIAEAFGKEFFENDQLKEDCRTQTAALLTLEFDLAPNENAWKNTCEFLKKDIVENRQLHLSTGFLGTPLLMKVLTKIKEVDLAYDLLQQTSYPGWLYSVTQGATTMWERWNSWSDTTGFGDVSMNSFNHYAYGAVGDWFFETICGIQPGQAQLDDTGFRRWKLQPEFGHSLNHASAIYRSICGEIKSSWQRADNGNINWTFTVPVNTQAELVLPDGWQICGQPANQSLADAAWIDPGTYELTLKEIQE